MDDERLFSAGTDRERALLAAGFDEGPSGRHVRAAAIALGLSPCASVSAVKARPFGGAGWVTTTLAIVAPVVGVAVALVALTTARTRNPAAPTVAPSVPAAAAPSPVPSAETASVGLPTAAETVVTLGDPVSRLTGDAPSDAAKRKGDTFSAQLALIDRARSLAVAGDLAGTLRSVDEYDRRFPGGLLSEEALLLRVEVVAASGGRAAAAHLARQFLAEYPRSVHADRLRPLLTP